MAITVRVGGRTYRYTFGNAAAAVGPSANIYMRNMIRERRSPSPQGRGAVRLLMQGIPSAAARA